MAPGCVVDPEIYIHTVHTKYMAPHFRVSEIMPNTTQHNTWNTEQNRTSFHIISYHPSSHLIRVRLITLENSISRHCRFPRLSRARLRTRSRHKKGSPACKTLKARRRGRTDGDGGGFNGHARTATGDGHGFVANAEIGRAGEGAAAGGIERLRGSRGARGGEAGDRGVGIAAF